MHPSSPRFLRAISVLTLGLVLLAACATPTFERYPPPPADEPFAEIELMLITASRKSAAGLYVPGTVRCARPGVEAFLNRTVEEPPRG